MYKKKPNYLSNIVLDPIKSYNHNMTSHKIYSLKKQYTRMYTNIFMYYRIYVWTMITFKRIVNPYNISVILFVYRQFI